MFLNRECDAVISFFDHIFDCTRICFVGFYDLIKYIFVAQTYVNYVYFGSF